MTLVESALAELSRQDGIHQIVCEDFDHMVKSYIRACKTGEIDGPVRDALPQIVKLVARATSSIADFGTADEEKMNLLQQSVKWAYDALESYQPDKGASPVSWIVTQVKGRLMNDRRDEYSRQNRTVSLDAPRGSDGDDDDGHLGDVISGTDEENPVAGVDRVDTTEGDNVGGSEAPFAKPDDVVQAKETKGEVERFLDSITNSEGRRIPNGLTPQERQIIDLSFGFGTEDHRTFGPDEIADRMGIAYRNVLSLKNRALNKMRMFKGRLSEIRDSVDPEVSKVAGEILSECEKAVPKGLLLKESIIDEMAEEDKEAL